MSGVLLDTHALLWLYQPTPMTLNALLAIEHAGASNELWVSPISAWELGAAIRKKNPAHRPNLAELSVGDWFAKATSSLGATSSPITNEIGLAASTLPLRYGSADPGDCFLIATAHTQQLTLITRDHRILEFAETCEGYFSAIRC